MFTTARICSLIGVACATFLGIANDKLAWWGIALLATVVATMQAITAFSGPVQNSASDNVVAKVAVARVTASELEAKG